MNGIVDGSGGGGGDCGWVVGRPLFVRPVLRLFRANSRLFRADSQLIRGLFAVDSRPIRADSR
eukprot:3406278-Prymnesium_polylepis.1